MIRSMLFGGAVVNIPKKTRILSLQKCRCGKFLQESANDEYSSGMILRQVRTQCFTVWPTTAVLLGILCFQKFCYSPVFSRTRGLCLSSMPGSGSFRAQYVSSDSEMVKVSACSRDHGKVLFQGQRICAFSRLTLRPSTSSLPKGAESS